MPLTTSETTVRQAPYLEDFQKRILEAAFARGETPVDVPPISVAGQDPLTLEAAAVGRGIGQYEPFLSAGAETIGTGLAALQSRAAGVPATFEEARQLGRQTAGGYDPASAAAFLDPYQKAVTTDALAEYRRQADIQRNQLAAQAANVSALGGSRETIAQQELGRNLADIQSRRIFEDASRNFNQAQNAAQTAFENQQRRGQGVAQLLGGLGTAESQEAVRLAGGIGSLGNLQTGIAGQGQGLISQQAALLSQLGATNQTQAQRELDAARQSELQQSYEPFQRVSFMSDIFKPQIGSASSTLGLNVAPSPSPLSQAIGTGIAAFGLQKGLGSPFGGLFGGAKRTAP
tara:strand:+ start:462 stop:1499 length:1038 start_codon:yes stop_codon:yes gene_type:complete